MCGLKNRQFWQYCRFCVKVGNMATRFSPLIAFAAVKPSVSRIVALKALQRITGHWKLKKSDLPRLLGQPARTVRDWFGRDRGPLDASVIERISHLLGIYDGLHRLFGDSEYADRWIHEPNEAFDAHTPAELLLTGTFTALVEVRRYIEQALLR